LVRSANVSLDAAQFNINAYLDNHTVIAATRNNKEVHVDGYRSNMGIADQFEQAYVEQQARTGKSRSGQSQTGLYLLTALLLAGVAIAVRARKAQNHA
jgi:uncharacterized protein YbcV (DUF1398 family)